MPQITVIRTLHDLRGWRSIQRSEGREVALTPTMGALHAGHLSLVEISRSRADTVIASLFVNPTQFAPNEDFGAYPRDEGRDFKLLSDAGCEAVYAPDVATIYPAGFDTTIIVGSVAVPLEGAFRPHHFAGVATVVAKLLIQVSPDLAVFGQKDYQQLQVIRRLVLDLDLPMEIVGAPIVREADGLALSSRNVYLTPSERAVAPALYEALLQAAEALRFGAEIEATEDMGRARVLAAGFTSVDYFEARDPITLARLPPGELSGQARILAAARLGRTRLIDNLSVTRPLIPGDG